MLLSRATTNDAALAGLRRKSAEHWNEVYAKLGVLLTDDDLWREPLRVADALVVERLDAAGLLQESEGALIVSRPASRTGRGSPCR